MCLHPTVRNSKNTGQVYPLIEKIKLISDKMYLDQVALSIQENKYIYGIKGPTYVSNWTDIPSSILLDYMHLCLIGSFKTMKNNFFDSKNKNESFYLGE